MAPFDAYYLQDSRQAMNADSLLIALLDGVRQKDESAHYIKRESGNVL